MPEDDLKPAPALTKEQKEKLNDAIVDGFSEAELRNALRYKWGVGLDNYVNVKQGFYNTVADFIAWTDRKGKTSELAALAYAERPGNDTVRQLAQDLGLPLIEIKQKYDPAAQPPARPPLQAMVARHSRFVNYEKFLKRFKAVGDRVCKIETPTKVGTGFLVGADLVLTNFHVVDEVAAADGKKVACEFDFHTAEEQAGNAGGQGNESTFCRLAANWEVAKSPFSKSDMTGVGEPKEDELDYALLRLEKKVGEAAGPSGAQRGWFDLAAERPVLAMRDFVVVPQHAQGRVLEVAWGAALSFNTPGNRVKHDATTDTGSSGSPCMTVDLDIFGLHHATDPNPNPKFNQAIPLDIIYKDLQAKKVV